MADAARSSGLLRRQLVGASAGALVLTAAGRVWAADAPRTARPATQDGTVDLVFLPFVEYPQSTPRSLFQHYLEPFMASHRGIRVTAVYGGIDAPSLITAILAGDGPDVWNQPHDLTVMMAGGYFLPLDTYISRDNIDMGAYPPAQVRQMQDGGRTYGLPNTAESEAFVVNLSTLDQLGVARPTAGWTYHEFDRIVRAAAGQVGKSWRYGAGFIYPEEYMYEGWGASYMAGYNSTRCTLNTPEAVACGEFFFSLLQDRAASYSYPSSDQFGSGEVVMYPVQPGDFPSLLPYVRGIEWDFFTTPLWPKGATSYAVSNGYFINARTRHPEASWELLKYLCVETEWQRAMFKMILLPPSILSLYDDWIQAVQAVAPPLRGKNLQVFRQLAEAATSYPHKNFAYRTEDAYAIVGGYFSKILGQNGSVYPWGWESVPGPAQMTVAEAQTQAAERVNALEASAAAVAASQQRDQAAASALIARAEASATAIAFPAPSRNGFGTPATAAAKGALSVHGSTYTLQGSGAGLQGETDGMTFACQAWAKSRGTFTCRLVSIGRGNTSSVQSGAKFGLMARGDLSNSAADVSVEVALDRGIHSEDRPLGALRLSDQRAGSSPGLFNTAGLLVASSTRTTNYLLKPVWLRLVQDANRWTAFTSLDGATWASASTTMVIEATGVWLGVFAAPKTAGGEYMTAVFDHVTFTPTAVYQL